RIATGPWNAVAQADPHGGGAASQTEAGTVLFSPPFHHGDGSLWVTVAYDLNEGDTRVAAIDLNGDAHPMQGRSHSSAGKMHQVPGSSGVPADQAQRIEFQARPYDHTAEFKNVTLDPEKKTKVEVKAEKG